MVKKLKGQLIIGIIAAVFLVLAVILGVNLTKNKKQSFPADGYVREIVVSDTEVDSNSVSFTKGTTYKTLSNHLIEFKDVKKKRTKVEDGRFAFFLDDSIYSFSDGMAVNMQETGKGYVDFYKLMANTVMVKSGSSWSVSGNNHLVEFPELIWQTKEDRLLAAAEHMTLQVAGKDTYEMEGPLEVYWVDDGIVQILSKDAAFQILTAGSRLIFDSGAVLDFDEKAAFDALGNVRFTLEELVSDMENGGIVLLSEDPRNWEAPEFILHNEDGLEGELGFSGELGSDGEEGKEGDEGEQGKIGADGVVGATGEKGADGEKGVSGDEGNAGDTGDNGAAGADGAGGANASIHHSGMKTDVQKIGDIRLAELVENDARSISFDLAITDEDDTFLEDTGVIEIREKETGKLVWFSETNFKRESERSFDVPRILNPNTEYQLSVEAGYAILVEGVTISGSKVLVTRDFTTTTDGILFDKEAATVNSVYLSVEQSSFSSATQFGLKIQSMGETILYPDDGSFFNVMDYANGKNEFEIPLAELLKERDIVVKSNIPYEITAYYSNGQNAALFTPNMDGTNYVGAESSELSENAFVISGSTLKKPPLIGQIFNSYSFGDYTLSCQVLEDQDSSINDFHYQIYSESGTLVADFHSESNVYVWNRKVELPAGIYTVTCEVSAFDNEKTIVKRAISGRLVSTFVNSMDAKFERYVRSGDMFVDSTVVRNYMAPYDNKASVSTNRIWGDVVLKPNGRVLDPDSNLTIKITSKSDPTYERQWSQPLVRRSGGATGSWYIPVKLVSLTPDTEYVISIYGVVQVAMDDGTGQASVYKNYEYLQSVTVKTEK